MRILNGMKYGVAVVLAVCVLFLLALILINAFDEDLDQEIVALAQRAQSEQIAQQGNAYFALVGLNAPHGQDIELAGKALHAEAQDQLRASSSVSEFRPIDPSSRPGAINFKGDSLQLCAAWRDDLYENGVCKYQAETERMLAENQELLQRYYRLLDYRLYEEPVIGYIWTGKDLLSLLWLAEADIEHKVAQGRVALAAELTVRNLAFWRNALEGKRRLLSEALFRVGYNVSQRSVSQLLWRHPQLLDKADFKAAFARPFTVSADNLQAQRDREFMDTYSVELSSDLVFSEGSGRSHNPVFKWAVDRLFQRNATLNEYYACTKRVYSVRALDGAAYTAAAAEYRDYSINHLGDLAVNPVGKIVLSGHCPKGFWFEDFDYGRFEASRRLITLEIELLKRKLPKNRYSAFLAAAPASLRDPLPGEPAKWDATTQFIFFEREKGCFSDGHWVSLAPVRDFKRCRS